MSAFHPKQTLALVPFSTQSGHWISRPDENRRPPSLLVSQYERTLVWGNRMDLTGTPPALRQETEVLLQSLEEKVALLRSEAEVPEIIGELENILSAIRANVSTG